MEQIYLKLLRWIKRSAGATLFEYTIVISLVAVLCVVLVRSIGAKTANSMEPVNAAIAP